MGGESGVEQAAALGLGLAEIISTFPCSRNRVVIRPGLETMVAIWSQAPREQSKHPSLADRPRGSRLVPGGAPPSCLRLGLVARYQPPGGSQGCALPSSPGSTPGEGSCAWLPGRGCQKVDHGPRDPGVVREKGAALTIPFPSG